jgi:uncharacterized protein YbbC (DUF1343 family)
MRQWLFLLSIVLMLYGFDHQSDAQKLVMGNAKTAEYFPLLKGKRVGCVVNQTSEVDGIFLVDSLLRSGVNVVRLFAPEHGFRGNADAGEKINNGFDETTGLPVVSLYGTNKKPTAEQLKGLDWLVFDIQDVGVRFYTYISTLHYAMEACAENGVRLMVLDRPNPNGDYVDGPVLDLKYRSFVGMEPIPVVYGLTIGELALMINGEGWLKNGVKCQLKVVEMANYDRQQHYSLSVKPSPNLPNDISIRLYPSLCFFEATDISVGRGTEFPFQVAGYPDEKFGTFKFKPISIAGMAKSPMHENKDCFGVDLRQKSVNHQFTLQYLLSFYQKWTSDKPFFTNRKFFNLLAANDLLINQIEKGLSEAEIRASWQADLNKYLTIRQHYLIY